METFLQFYEPAEEPGHGLHLRRAVEYRMSAIPSRSGANVHDCWALDFVYTEGTSYRVGAAPNPWRERPACTAHLYAPGTPYWEDSSRLTSPLQGGFCLFDNGEAAGLPELLSPSLQYVQIIDHASSIGTLLHDMAETGICRGGQGEWRVYGLFYMLMDLLRSSRTVNDSTRILKVDKPGSALSVADEAQAYLRRNIHRRVALEELAAHCGCSLSTITHQYRRQTGESPLITHMRLRIDVAKMLVQQGYSLETIAAQTGFCDAYHLAKTFKRFVGISSRQYACAARPPELGCACPEETI